jgi:hypothetical protein
LAVVVLAAASSPASAQIKSKIIDTDSLVVKPTDTLTNIVGGTTKFASRVVAGTLDNNAIVRTLNNLFGRTEATPNPYQPGTISPLPPVTAYPANYFNSPIKPQMPKYMTIQR